MTDDDTISSSGCVFPEVRPVLHLNVGTHGGVAQHVRAAQASGLPTRLANKQQQDRNGRTACPARFGEERPFDHSCDEYPFRSTYEGAARSEEAGGRARTHIGDPKSAVLPFACRVRFVPVGVTGPGWSVCWVRARDNSRAGADTGAFYRTQRVIDREPFVVVVDG